MQTLAKALVSCSSLEEKVAHLTASVEVCTALKKNNFLRALLPLLSSEQEYLVKQLVAIGQWERLVGKGPWEVEEVQKFLQQLLPADAFYREIGGLIGYQEKVLELLKRKVVEENSSFSYHAPSFIDIAEETETTQEAIQQGLFYLPQMAEMYPLGGAADRLHLVDEITGLELPAAKLCFAGWTLLERLIRDLQARESLYFERYGEQLTTPIVIMTSEEKENHRHVLAICEEKRWFGRPKDSFYIFTQPLVPTVNEEGNWCCIGRFHPLLKPGGHGAIWKLARDAGVFRWLAEKGRKRALLRQINNPIAGLDYGLLAFIGHGSQKERIFGFASCPRLLQAAEGVNVLIQKNEEEIVLTNIEYCDFERLGIEDRPLQENGHYSRFSSNTNILFVDLQAVAKAVERSPYPGLLINLKKGSFLTEEGEKREEVMARLESTMQNIADVFVEKKKEKLQTEKTFVTYNHRHKTIATAKKAYLPGRSLQETPENCFYELLRAARELLEHYCQFQLPPERSLEEHLQKGPSFVFLYHPALGPLYSLIRQKVSQGRLHLGAELQLEIAELTLHNLDLDGSLLIRADQVMGHFEGELLHYSEQRGRAILHNVRVCNQGVSWENSEPFWKGQFHRKESLEIILRGHSEFVAEDVIFEGAHQFVVEDGMRLRVEQRGEEHLLKKEKIPALKAERGG